MKRLFDITFSILILLLTLPFFILAAMLIKLCNGGPVIFRQRRVGRNGRIFILIKFSTMNDVAGPILTSSKDSRITTIGKFLRRTHLDELPQFINVVKGEMSVVGPRPEIPEIVKTYTEEQRRILTFKPGVTSYATVKFRDEERLLACRKDIVDFYIKDVLPYKIRYDLDYFEHKSSFLNDLLIILKTLWGVFNFKPCEGIDKNFS